MVILKNELDLSVEMLISGYVYLSLTSLKLVYHIHLFTETAFKSLLRLNFHKDYHSDLKTNQKPS